jgi:hypothetical protein
MNINIFDTHLTLLWNYFMYLPHFALPLAACSGEIPLIQEAKDRIVHTINNEKRTLLMV